jgi:hypothetical protein
MPVVLKGSECQPALRPCRHHPVSSLHIQIDDTLFVLLCNECTPFRRGCHLLDQLPA